MKIICALYFIIITSFCFAQTTNTITGKIISEGQTIDLAVISLKGTTLRSVSDSFGFYIIKNIPLGKYQLEVSYVGFNKFSKTITIGKSENIIVNVELIPNDNKLNEVVITGTLKEVSRKESAVSVEIYKPTFFKKNPTPSIFDALQNVNGVRPQLNCSVCNTGDIQINGLKGPYTMVLIDGMPIVSSLSTVYGLSGIPNSLIERIEIVKGPASSLYGSEAVGGLINIITKKPQNTAQLFADIMSTSWQEHNIDVAFKTKVNSKSSLLTGINYFNFQNKVDNNNDNFTDITLQNRVSIFQKWNFERKNFRVFSLAARYMFEDRWGGELNWNKNFRGGDSIYGESIYTKRWELISNYQLPTKEKLILSFSYNNHHQDSRYGTTSYIAQQNIAFSQLTWDKKKGNNDLLIGAALRYTFYDDNTPATENVNGLETLNQPQHIWLPGLFIQNEITLNTKQKLLLGFRYDYNTIHGNIYTPRVAYKYSINEKNILRINAGTGFRVVNLFTEDHAALTGARIVDIKSELNPEQSYNININYLKKIFVKNGNIINIDGSFFYTYFNNRIIGDYEIDPNKIVYDNLKDFAQSKGVCINTDYSFNNGLKVMLGGTVMENSITEDGITEQQILTEKFTGIWSLSYKFSKANLTIDYTGNVYSPMRLPLLGPYDPRSAYSPWWSIQNIQLTFAGVKKVEIYGGVKNLLNWTPNKGNPFLIARAHDPFDKAVQYNTNGQVMVTPNNPYGLTFDPTYIYAPNQGIRFFLGARVIIK